MTGDRADSRRTGRKGVLFCPVCGHDSPLDADWDVTESPQHGRTDIACSTCGHVVVTQPTFEDTSDSRNTIFSPVAKFVNTVVESGVSSTRFPVRLS